MTTTDRLMLFLDATLAGETLLAAEADLLELVNDCKKADPSRATPPVSLESDQKALLVSVTAEMLLAVAQQNSPLALTKARQLGAYSLPSDPFAGKSFRLAAELATDLRDKAAADYFAGRYQSYLSLYLWGSALQALGEGLGSPYLAADERELGDVREALLEARPADLLPLVMPPAELVPLSSSRHEPPTRTYIVLVRKLQDPVTAAFAVFPATLADFTDGGLYGRADRHGDLYADLLLEFGADALPMLETVALSELSMRFVFKTSMEYETFSVTDKTLFDLETVVEESRLYFKLKIPPSWRAAEVPLHLVWANVESCVLLSVSG